LVRNINRQISFRLIEAHIFDALTHTAEAIEIDDRGYLARFAPSADPPPRPWMSL
jgi:hypothetical protein